VSGLKAPVYSIPLASDKEVWVQKDRDMLGLLKDEKHVTELSM
jgi:hypothetical protein